MRCGTVRTDGTIDDESCPPNGGTTTGTTTPQGTTTQGTTTESTTTEGTTTGGGVTTTTAGALSIASFTVGEADCSGGATTTSVMVQWNGVNATGSEFEIDGQAPGAQAGFGGSGAANFDLPCDGEDHTISLTVFNAEGETATETRDVQT